MSLYSSTKLHIPDHDFYIPIDIVWYYRLAIEGRDPGFNSWVGRFFSSSFLACDTILLAPFTTKDGSREGGRETETCHDIRLGGSELPWVRISDARWRPAVRGKVCVYGLCMGFGVHTALINLHPVSDSVEDGFELCRMYRSWLALKLSFFCRLSFSLLRSPIMCLRRSRSSTNHPEYPQIQEAAIEQALHDDRVAIP